MRCHVALTPGEAAAAPLGIVVDVMRATSTIAQALAGGYQQVLCCAEIEDALALKAELGDEAITGGERDANRVEGFDAGASPREFREPRAETLILSTTNGTRSIVAAAEACDQVVLGALLNLDAVAAYARESGVDYTVDCAGRIVRLAGGERTDAAIACELVAERFPNAIDGINARTYGPPGLEEDIAFCAQESILDVVPRFSRMVGPAAEVVA